MEKRLYKSNNERMICGVCGGIAEYFNVDPTLIRIGTAILCLATGIGVLGYIAAAIIMPKNPEDY